MTNRTAYRCLLAFVFVFVPLCTTPAALDQQPAASELVKETARCLDCHFGQDATLTGTTHALGDDGGAYGAGIACTDCHGTDSRHLEIGPDDYPMTQPRELDVIAVAELCSSCHQTSHQQNIVERNVHTTGGIGCTDCHAVHSSRGHTALLKKEEPALCYECHARIEVDFERSYRHPVSDGVVRCSECHTSLDLTRLELSYNGVEVCGACHAEFWGPFPFEHQATLDYSTEEGGCLNCHAAHGSDNPRMLRQPYEPPRFQLCTQCHMIPAGHNSNSMHGTAWAGLACSSCHTDVHGSYTSRFLLSETLAAEGCLNASCHGR